VLHLGCAEALLASFLCLIMLLGPSDTVQIVPSPCDAAQRGPYDPPEGSGALPLSPDRWRGDMWSFGVTVLAAASSLRPFEGFHTATLGAPLPVQSHHCARLVAQALEAVSCSPQDRRWLARLCARCIVVDPGARAPASRLLAAPAPRG